MERDGDFRTDHGVPFTFDTNRCGSDILIAEAGLSASYGGMTPERLSQLQLYHRCNFLGDYVTQSSTAYIFVGVASSM